jgi:hypothetical protein
LTAGVWQFGTPEYKELNEFQTSNSDVITYHTYAPVKDSDEKTAQMKKFGRPVICTEYMNRPTSTFQTHLPMFQREGVWAINWGLVDGKTQTKYPWGSKPNGPEPKPWFHEVFHPDGKPYDSKETDLMKQLTRKQS